MHTGVVIVCFVTKANDMRSCFGPTACSTQVDASLKDNEYLADLDPNIVGQPHISLEKLMAMYTDTVRLWNAANGNYKTLSGNNAPFRDFCRGKGLLACSCMH